MVTPTWRLMAVTAVLACSEATPVAAIDTTSPADLSEGDASPTDIITPTPDVEDGVTPDDVVPTDVAADAAVDAAVDAAEPTWPERFEHVIPSTGVVPITLDFADGDWGKLLAAWADGQQKLAFPAAMTHGDSLLPKR